MYQKTGIRINHISGFVNQFSDIWRYHQNKGGEFVFYDRFFELCQRKGVTPTKVARDLGLRQSTVSMWKKQGTTPKYDTVNKLADYFGVTTDDLYDIKPLPDGKVELNLSSGKETVTLPGKTLEFKAVTAFLKEIGFLIGLNESLFDELTESGVDPKEAEAWVIADKRAKKVYLAKATDVDALEDRILSFSKFEIYELLRRIKETDIYDKYLIPWPPTPEPPQTPPAPQESRDTTPPPEGTEEPQEGE